MAMMKSESLTRCVRVKEALKPGNEVGSLGDLAVEIFRRRAVIGYEVDCCARYAAVPRPRHSSNARLWYRNQVMSRFGEWNHASPDLENPEVRLSGPCVRYHVMTGDSLRS